MGPRLRKIMIAGTVFAVIAAAAWLEINGKIHEHAFSRGTKPPAAESIDKKALKQPTTAEIRYGLKEIEKGMDANIDGTELRRKIEQLGPIMSLVYFRRYGQDATQVERDNVYNQAFETAKTAIRIAYAKGEIGLLQEVEHSMDFPPAVRLEAKLLAGKGVKATLGPIETKQ